MILQWHHWAIIGVALVLSELLIPAFVLVWFGLGALVVAVLVALLPMTFIAQLLIWIVASVALVFLWFKVFKPQTQILDKSLAQAIGEVGLLISDIEPFTKAKVRFQTPLIGSDVWECVAEEKIKAGSRVRVVSVEGHFLKITSERNP